MTLRRYELKAKIHELRLLLSMNCLSALLGLLLLFAPSPSQACEMADQYRLLPLGMSSGDLVALELDQFRDQDSPTGPVFWRVSPRLVTVQPNQPVIPITDYQRLELSDRDYEKEIAPTIERAVKDAKKLPGFTGGELVSMVECHFAKSCNQHRVAFNEKKREARVEIKDAGLTATTSIRFPARFLRHKNAFYVEGERTKLDNDLIHKKYPYLLGTWLLGSVRVYRFDNKTFAVVHLGHGDLRFYACDGCEPSKKKLPPQVESVVYNEAIPHHGAGFDIAVQLN